MDNKYTLPVIIGVAGIVLGYMVATKTNNPTEDFHKYMMGDDSMAQHVEHMFSPDTNPPRVTLSVTEDPKSGWNINVRTENFKFAPDKAGQTHVAGEGHGHVFLDDIKIGRVYGEWFYLDSKYLSKGAHKLKVVLNGNDHGDIMVNGQHVQSETMLMVK